MYTNTESTLLGILTYMHAPSFTTNRDMGAVSKKKISDQPFLT